MLTLPDAILPVLHPFATLFRSPTWLKAQILLAGAILAPGQRTVAAALRVMGRSDHLDYARYHEVLNRRVARDNTVKYYRHTLQLLPTQQRRSYAGAVVVVLEGLDGRLLLQHEGRNDASQEAPPSPASLRSRNGTSPAAAIPPSDPELASKPSVAALDLPGAKPDQDEGDHAAAIGDPEVAGLRVVDATEFRVELGEKLI